MTNSQPENETQEIESILAQIESKFQKIKERMKHDQTVILYQPGRIPKENRFIMLIRVEIEYALRQLVESHAKNLYRSLSATDLEGLLNVAEEHSLIDDHLAQDVRDFYAISTSFIRQSMAGPLYMQLQYISSDILERLLQIPLGPV